jgi:serine protease AprX
MHPTLGITRQPLSPATLRALVVAVVAAMLLPVLFAGARLGHVGTGPLVSVVVRGQPGGVETAERLVTGLGGRITQRLDIIDGFAAEVPQAALAAVAAAGEISSVTPNGQVQLLKAPPTGGGGGTFDQTAETTYDIAQSIGAAALYKLGFTGRGIDVAVIDSGSVDLPELAGRIVNGPDLSFQSNAQPQWYIDDFGHGVFIDGIITGDDPTASGGRSYQGIAPDARIVNVRVAVRSGVTDLSQVLAAIDWVVQHRNDNGLNIRVLNLSFGTDGNQSYLRDPLAYAAEVAWRKGIVVVVAAGNEGYGDSALNNPAYDPYVLAVGAADMVGTYAQTDDIVAAFSSRGSAARRPDLVAPGRSVVSLRNVGSYIDRTNPEGRVGDRFFKGSGTSGAAAVVSGAVALLLQQRPLLTPDQVKCLLKQTAAKLTAIDVGAGSGEINVLAASKARPSSKCTQKWPLSTGTGSLQLARGSSAVSDNRSVLSGEKDIFGAPWNGNTWAQAAWDGNTWSGGVWNGNTWSGNTWSGNTWSGNTWSGNTWSGNTWTGNTWSGNTWTGNTWSSASWGP